MPEICPACGGAAVRLPGEAARYCTNGLRCPAQLIEALQHFASRRAMDITGLGVRTATQLTERGLVANLADLYDLRREDLMGLTGFAGKSADNLLANLNASRRRPCDRVLYALGIHGVGDQTARLLTRHFPSLDALAAASPADLQAIPTIGPALSDSLSRFFADEGNRRVIERLREAGLRMTGASEPVRAGPLAGKHVVFTGRLTSLTRPEAEALVERLGGQAGSSVSPRTDLVVAGPEAGSKLAMARRLGIQVVDEAAFNDLVGRQAS